MIIDIFGSTFIFVCCSAVLLTGQVAGIVGNAIILEFGANELLGKMVNHPCTSGELAADGDP